jgi:predicted kinase
MTRYLLWSGEDFESPMPFIYREAIARLVRFHGLPLWLLEKADPRYAVLAASQSAPLDWVALLAEADVRGRECADRDRLLERITLFREFAAECNCLTQAYPFPTDHSRFRYFRHAPDATSQATEDRYAAYDDTSFEVTLMCGLPGSGKDTRIREHAAGLPVISLDAIRDELRVSPRERQDEVVRTAYERARELLRTKTPFIWNATNVTRALRGRLIDLCYSYGARTKMIYTDAARETILQRNRVRIRRVPDHVLDRLARKLEVPDATEAHAVAWVTTKTPAVRDTPSR